MALLPPVHILAPTIVRYTFKHDTAAANNADNVVDISIDAAGTVSRDDSVDDFNSHICGMWQDTVLQCFGTSTLFLGASWIDLDSADGRTGTLGPAAAHPTHGVQTPPFAPPSISYLVHKNTVSRRGERGGRMYIPDVPEASVNDAGGLSGGAIALIEGEVGGFRTNILGYTNTVAGTAFNPAAWRVVHVHKLDKLDPTTWTWSSSDVTSIRCDPIVGSQRRRQR